MSVTIKSDAIDFSKWTDSLVANQIPWFMLRTVNDMAFHVRDDTIDSMKKELSNPTPWTLKSIWVDKAKNKNMIRARAWLNDYGGQEQVLQHEFTGGLRRFKPFEGQFLRAGVIDKDLIIVPAAGCPLDSFGNPQHAFVMKMLTYMGIFVDQKMTQKNKDKLKKKIGKSVAGDVEFFLSTGKGIRSRPAGIWMRVTYSSGTAVKPVFLFVKKGTYKKRIDMEEIGLNEFASYGQKILDDYLQKALEEKLSGPD